MRRKNPNPGHTLIYELDGQLWLDLSLLYEVGVNIKAMGMDGEEYSHRFPDFSVFMYGDISYEVQGRDPSAPRLWIRRVGEGDQLPADQPTVEV